MTYPLTLLIQTTLFERRLALVEKGLPLEFRIDPEYPMEGPYSSSNRLLYRPTSIHRVRLIDFIHHRSNALVELPCKTQGFLTLGQKTSSLSEGQWLLAQVTRAAELASTLVPPKGPMLSTHLKDLSGRPLLPEEIMSLKAASSNLLHPCCVWKGWSYLERYLQGYKDKISLIIVDTPSLEHYVIPMIKEWKHPPHIQLFKPSLEQNSLFEAYDLETSWDTLESPLIPLKQGGTLILEKTHAGWVYDLNKPLRHSASLQTNIQAGIQVIKDIRLKNLSGLIVADFLPLTSHKKRELFFQKIKAETKNDPFPPLLHGLSALGLLEITRPKQDLSLLEERLLLLSTPQESPHALEKKILRDLEQRRWAHPQQTNFTISLENSPSPSFLKALETLQATYGLSIEASYPNTWAG